MTQPTCAPACHIKYQTTTRTESVVVAADADVCRVVSRQRCDPSGCVLITTFPRQPVWWSNASLNDRQTLCRLFNTAELAMVIEDVLARTVNHPTTVEDIAALVRRQWTLAWFVELAAGALPTLQADEQIEIQVRYWQWRAGRYLGELTWRFLMDLPPRLLDQAIRIAASSADEIDDFDPAV